MKQIKLYVLIFCVAMCALSACSDDDDKGNIEGVITYSDQEESQLLENATVRLYVAKVADEGLIEGEANLKPIRETTSDNKGKYSFSGVETGNYWITVTGEAGGKLYSTAKLSPVGIMLIGGQTEVVDIVVQVQ